MILVSVGDEHSQKMAEDGEIVRKKAEVWQRKCPREMKFTAAFFSPLSSFPCFSALPKFLSCALPQSLVKSPPGTSRGVVTCQTDLGIVFNVIGLSLTPSLHFVTGGADFALSEK